MTVARTSTEDLEKAVKENPQDIISVFLLDWDKGNGLVAKTEDLDNGLWAEWRPTEVVEFVIRNS